MGFQLGPNHHHNQQRSYDVPTIGCYQHPCWYDRHTNFINKLDAKCTPCTRVPCLGTSCKGDLAYTCPPLTLVSMWSFYPRSKFQVTLRMFDTNLIIHIIMNLHFMIDLKITILIVLIIYNKKPRSPNAAKMAQSVMPEGYIAPNTTPKCTWSLKKDGKSESPHHHEPLR